MSAGPDDEVLNDRRAIEAIVGRPLDDDPWPANALPPGTRVRVVKVSAWDGPWREVFLGTIDLTFSPQLVQHRIANLGEWEYSVNFDAPQFDAAGSGPYRKAVIWDRYLARPYRPELTHDHAAVGAHAPDKRAPRATMPMRVCRHSRSTRLSS